MIKLITADNYVHSNDVNKHDRHHHRPNDHDIIIKAIVIVIKISMTIIESDIDGADCKDNNTDNKDSIHHHYYENINEMNNMKQQYSC